MDNRKKFLWEQVRDSIIADITTGKLKSGDKLPSFSEMCKRTGYSLPVIKLAYNDLKNRGLVYVESNRGVYISDSPLTKEQENDNFKIMRNSRLDIIDRKTSGKISNTLNLLYVKMLTDRQNSFSDLCAVKSSALIFEMLSQIMPDNSDIYKYLTDTEIKDSSRIQNYNDKLHEENKSILINAIEDTLKFEEVVDLESFCQYLKEYHNISSVTIKRNDTIYYFCEYFSGEIEPNNMIDSKELGRFGKSELEKIIKMKGQDNL